MMKLLMGLLIVIFGIFFSSCGPASPQMTGTPTPTTIVVIATVTASPTRRPSATPTPSMWAEPFRNHIELKDFTGLWSPTSNEVVGIDTTAGAGDFENSRDALILASAPTFHETRLVNDTSEDTTIGFPIWSMDGKKIFYGIYNQPESWMNRGTLWSITRDGSNALSYGGGLGGFQGWMDDHTLIHSSYEGGGTSFVAGFDILKNDYVIGDGITGGLEAMNANYMAIATCLPVCYVCVLPRVTNIHRPPDRYNCDTEPAMQIGNTRPFPHSEVYAKVSSEDYPYIETIFQDWQTGSNNMLVLGQGKIENKFTSRLLLWNADTNKVTSLAPGGLFGKFSPNGKMLAYITSGPSNQYPEKNAQNIPLDFVTFDDKQYLQVMNMNTRQIMIRVPIKTYRREDYSSSSGFDFTKPDELSFSPDNRYLSFVTGGYVMKDARFPTEITLADTDKVYLNILDLQAVELVQSLLLESYDEYTYPNVLWALTNQNFVYQDGRENWHLFQLSNKAVLPITQAKGDHLINPAWSYDGSYLSFESRYESINKHITTYILTMNN